MPLTNLVFSVRTVSFPFDLWPKREERRPNIEKEKRGFVTYSSERENEVSEIFIIYCMNTSVRVNISSHVKITLFHTRK